MFVPCTRRMASQGNDLRCITSSRILLRGARGSTFTPPSDPSASSYLYTLLVYSSPNLLVTSVSTDVRLCRAPFGPASMSVRVFNRHQTSIFHYLHSISIFLGLLCSHKHYFHKMSGLL